MLVAGDSLLLTDFFMRFQLIGAAAYCFLKYLSKVNSLCAGYVPQFAAD